MLGPKKIEEARRFRRIRFLDEKKLREVIFAEFGRLAKRNVIHITSKALCVLAHRYADKLVLNAISVSLGPVMIPQLGVTLRKVLLVALALLDIPMIYLGGICLHIATPGISYGFYLYDYLNKIEINISPVSTYPLDNIGTRMPGHGDVIVYNNEPVLIDKPESRFFDGCWLPNIVAYNDECTHQRGAWRFLPPPTGDADISRAVEVYVPPVDPDSVTTLRDVTGLSQTVFGDIESTGSCPTSSE